ncbi:MAG: hypothetical protein HYT10_01350 [Candidatus Levybacteria bacterium]|nr:hypothetical protein [Candidatus Levybacteria bacterium]
MKKIVLVCFFVALVVGAVYKSTTSKSVFLSPLSGEKNISSPTITSLAQKGQEKESIFIPYWSVGNSPLYVEDFDEQIYFGIAVNEEGIDKTEDGYRKLSQFMQNIPSVGKKLLVVRMINSKLNSRLLEKTELQEKIIQGSIATAKQYHFSGIVLDYELSALSFESVIKGITHFYQRFEKASRRQNLSFSATVFGDTFFRVRPYDVEKIGQTADTVYIMAYDFHKSRGNPGPNFPFSGKNTYGYDFQTMIKDFSQVVPSHKLSVIFGMFGYNWPVDERHQSTGNGVALSLKEAKQQFVDACKEKSCSLSYDSVSAENKVMFQDAIGIRHIVWFEDEKSVLKKREYAKKKGIVSIGYWAYSFF